MQGAGFRRGFPWNTTLIVCSVPFFVLAIFAAWFRWELPPLQGYYLQTYWESSSGASSAQNTTSIQWLYKSASGRKSVPAIPQDVEWNGVGFVPFLLSSSGRQDGWTQLVKLPAQAWSSRELETFFQRDVYDGHTFSQVISQPMLLVCIVPVIFIFGAIYLWHDIVEEWKRFYGGPFGDDLIVDVAVLKQRFLAFFGRWRGSNASLESRASESGKDTEQATAQSASENNFQTIENSSLSAEKQAIQVVPSAKPKSRSIFPGAHPQWGGDKASLPWDESQWIE